MLVSIKSRDMRLSTDSQPIMLSLRTYDSDRGEHDPTKYIIDSIFVLNSSKNSA